MWGALGYGGKLVVIPYWISRSPEEFYEVVRQEGITVLNMTPSAFQQFQEVDERKEEELRLRYVIFGGEALEMERLRRWYERKGGAGPQLVNMYGITETTVHVTYGGLDARVVEGASSWIGRRLGDLKTYVLGKEMEALPAGVPGELYVGGRGLGRGYLGRGGLTAERFVPNPYGEREGERLYRSGDRVRWRTEGSLEYLGRVDDQVKVRGFRIELGEIEAQLREHRGVREAAVVLREDEPGEKRLVAYIVEREGMEVGQGEWRGFLQGRLPEYMVPSALVKVGALPLNANGKLDRRALPAPDRNASCADTYLPPRTETEKMLCEIWSEVLRLERVGIHDNFFELGGDSILSIQVITRCKHAGLDLTPGDIFRQQTVALLAEAAKQSSDSLVAAHGGLAPLEPQRFALSGLSSEKLNSVMNRLNKHNRR
jgi:acyl-coenzyme A synthetase/AMP-(fatty) acid ligase